jgi:hypothetical protein
MAQLFFLKHRCTKKKSQYTSPTRVLVSLFFQYLQAVPPQGITLKLSGNGGVLHRARTGAKFGYNENHQITNHNRGCGY